jgi:uncharacterized protein YuzE
MDAFLELAEITIAEDDQEHVLYIRVRPGPRRARRELDQRTTVDYDERHQVLGIEIRHARFTGTLAAMSVLHPAAEGNGEVRSYGLVL